MMAQQHMAAQQQQQQQGSAGGGGMGGGGPVGGNQQQMMNNTMDSQNTAFNQGAGVGGVANNTMFMSGQQQVRHVCCKILCDRNMHSKFVKLIRLMLPLKSYKSINYGLYLTKSIYM